MPTGQYAQERAALANARRLSASLQPGAKAKLNSAITAVSGEVIANAGANVLTSAQREIQQLFPQANPDQVGFLILCVVAEVAIASRVIISPQTESRIFASVSNVLKTRHGIDKSAISNIR